MLTRWLVAVLLLAACSSGTTAEAPPPEEAVPPEPTFTVPPATGPGKYEFFYQGATGVVDVPTPATDPRLAEVEAYRQLAGAPEVEYFAAEVDNQAGVENINMYAVVVITEDGRTIQAREKSRCTVMERPGRVNGAGCCPEDLLRGLSP
jgi:hypothetical protein